jgi:hypothetical protein
MTDVIRGNGQSAQAVSSRFPIVYDVRKSSSTIAIRDKFR